MAFEDTSSDETPKDSSKMEKGQADGADGQSPPEPVHFFHPSLNKVRREVYMLWVRTSTLLSTNVPNSEMS